MKQGLLGESTSSTRVRFCYPFLTKGFGSADTHISSSCWSTCSITIPRCLIRVTTEAPDPAQHKPTFRGSLRYLLCSEQGWLKCRQILFCYLTYRGSDLQHRAGQTAGSGDVKPDRQDSLETLCQRQILDFIFNFFFDTPRICQP